MKIKCCQCGIEREIRDVWDGHELERQEGWYLNVQTLEITCPLCRAKE